MSMPLQQQQVSIDQRGRIPPGPPSQQSSWSQISASKLALHSYLTLMNRLRSPSLSTIVSHGSKKLSKPAPSQPNEYVEKDETPWKYRGYRAMSTWMASDDDFFVLRRFGKLGARTALYLQDQVVYLEEQLNNLDRICEDRSQPDQDNGTFRQDRQDRKQIMEILVSKLERYQRFLLDHSQLKARMDATDFQVSNVKNWLHNSNHTIKDEEANFIDHEGDLIPVVPIIKTPLRRFIDRFPGLRRITCFRNRKRNETFHDFESKTTIYNKESRFDKFVTCATIVVGLGMLIAPLWLLQYLSSEKPDLISRLIVITAFMIVFTIMIIVVTVAKPYETLGATAAYGAVMMVFMQLSPSAGS